MRLCWLLSKKYNASLKYSIYMEGNNNLKLKPRQRSEEIFISPNNENCYGVLRCFYLVSISYIGILPPFNLPWNPFMESQKGKHKVYPAASFQLDESVFLHKTISGLIFLAIGNVSIWNYERTLAVNCFHVPLSLWRLFFIFLHWASLHFFFTSEGLLNLFIEDWRGWIGSLKIW